MYVFIKYMAKDIFIKEIIHEHTGVQYVLKETIPNQTEIDILSRLRHPNIISMIKFWTDKKNQLDNNLDYSLYIMTELGRYTLENCNEYVKRLNREFFVIDMITAVHFLHSDGIAHCNINPSNFIVVSMSKRPIVKLTNFSTCVHKDNLTYNQEITIQYASPEILSVYHNMNIRGVKDHTSNIADDLWALGCTILYWFFGYSPFGTNFGEIESNLRDYLIYPQLYLMSKRVPGHWKKTVKLLLELDPIKRLTNFQEIITHHQIPTTIISDSPSE